jgi:hypothetical protein
MPSSDDQHPQTSSIKWLAVMRTLLFQVFVLLALAVAFAGYVEWSSETTWAEFIAASSPSARESGQPPQSSPVQTAKDQKLCKQKKG